MQFSIILSSKLQLKIEVFPKSRKLNFVPWKLQLENPVESSKLSEKSQFVNTQLVKLINLKDNPINLHPSKVDSSKSLP